jgi:hypothetical protein
MLKTAIRLAALRPEFDSIYLPCKAKRYLHDLSTNSNRCITVLRHLLRLDGEYVLTSKQSYNENKKRTLYTIKLKTSLLVNTDHSPAVARVSAAETTNASDDSDADGSSPRPTARRSSPPPPPAPKPRIFVRQPDDPLGPITTVFQLLDWPPQVQGS